MRPLLGAFSCRSATWMANGYSEVHTGQAYPDTWTPIGSVNNSHSYCLAKRYGNGSSCGLFAQYPDWRRRPHALRTGLTAIMPNGNRPTIKCLIANRERQNVDNDGFDDFVEIVGFAWGCAICSVYRYATKGPMRIRVLIQGRRLWIVLNGKVRKPNRFSRSPEWCFRTLRQTKLAHPNMPEFVNVDW